MSREISAEPVLAAEQTALLALHRLTPERSLLDLLDASSRINDPVRLSLFHIRECATCATQALSGGVQPCARGARLIGAARGWRIARPLEGARA
jgi:hypothetical protein